ncbi:MAG: phosphatidylglycerophosphatase A [Desulfobacterota bacterium]|nr:phosphatidylglycerophosphatase A [Thermodesulfobacteriota bacterium]MDW8001745.1 phosphatidylglycerophosphatase A [Deltaproteobacteria bacterium]
MKRLAKDFLSLGPLGYFPYFPGTLASLLICLLLFFLRSDSPLIFEISVLFVLSSLTVVSVLTSDLKEKDPRFVVMDEVIGMYLTVLNHTPCAFNLFVGFILFRFFDIMKPYPLKKIEKLPGALGILADDILAGLYANLSLCLIERLSRNVL